MFRLTVMFKTKFKLLEILSKFFKSKVEIPRVKSAKLE